MGGDAAVATRINPIHGGNSQSARIKKRPSTAEYRRGGVA